VYQTLDYIPHEIGPLPVFGFGWLLIALAVVGVPVLARLVRRQGLNADTLGYLIVLGVLALAIAFVLPRLEVVDVKTEEHGVPIRGYGVMMLLGVVSGVALAAYRARQMGMDPEIVYSASLYMFVAAIVGARAFFVIQFWDQFQKETLWETVSAAINVTQGGLVVYGSLVGGLAAGLWFVRRRNLPTLALGDLIAPSMFLGLAFGRIGCLLNGCCFGGPCEHLWAVRFPDTAPVYEHQHRTGQLHGFQVGPDEDGEPIVSDLFPHGPAAESGLRVGDRIVAINGRSVHVLMDRQDNPIPPVDAAHTLLARSKGALTLALDDGRTADVSIAKMPAESLDVHPTQIYSSVNATCLFLFLAAYYPYRRRDGEVIALALTLYPATRFLLEVIRDEPRQFGLTIAQIVSLLILVFVAGLWTFVLRQDRGSVLPLADNRVT